MTVCPLPSPRRVHLRRSLTRLTQRSMQLTPPSPRSQSPRRSAALRRARILAALALAGLAGPAGGQAERNLLSGEVTEAEVAAMLVPRQAWTPFPAAGDRTGWAAVPQATREAYIGAAEQLRGTEWKSIPATVALRFERAGDRKSYDDLNSAQREKLATLVTAEVLEGRGRFVDDILNGIWHIAEQTYWGSPAHLYLQADKSGLPDVEEPTVDLFAAETGALLAWTDYLLGEQLDAVSPLVRRRIRAEVDRRILTPALQRDDFWWMGFNDRGNVNNWNPWINSNWLAAALLLEDDPARRAAAVHKVMRSTDRFINVYPDDGASDEGPGYWGRAGASLFDVLELLRSATGGRVDIYDHPLIRNMGQYIYRVYIGGEYFVNTGDASGKTRPDPELVYAYGQRIGDPVMTQFGALLARRRGPYGPGSSSPGRILPALMSARQIGAAEAAEPLLADAWMPDLQLMAARTEGGSNRGFYLSALGGHNAQSHNHNDVGHFIVYADGLPVLVDVGVETYSAKTFSPQRYDIWTMQSAYHNLPTINGVMQEPGRDARAEEVRLERNAGRVSFSADIAPAYPDSAGVERWMRTVTLDRRAPRVELRERYTLSRWVEPVRLNFMTPLRVDVSAPGQVHLRADAGDRRFVLGYDAAKFTATSEEIVLTDPRLQAVWGDRLARVVLVSRERATRGDHRVLLRYDR